MNITLFTAIAILATALVNLVDWLVWKGGRLLCFPSAGWLRFAMQAVIAGTFICSVLLLAGIVSASTFFAVVFVQAMTHESYSIWCRHRARLGV